MTRKRVAENFLKYNKMKMLRENDIIKLNNIELLPVPDKSASDRKNYKLIRLSNGLKALLISDPMESDDDKVDDDTESDDESLSDESSSTNGSKNSTHSDESKEDTDSKSEKKLAAAALMVDVGSFSDPPEIQGLAHFLEHMIFMGSKKYPEENEYDSYIKKFGGSDNADTDCEETSFYLEIPEKYLEGALDRFAQLMTDPLMHREAMTREREIVESEFNSKKQGDGVRRDQLLASLSLPDHPSGIFTWGNLETLKDNIDDNTLYEKVHEFRLRHYSAHRMYLCIQARLSLDILENYAVKYFSNIQNNNLPGDETLVNYRNEPVFRNEFYNSIYYVKPISNINRIDISWCFPSLVAEYKCKAHHYIGFILGYEGKGSLLSYFREKLWALELMAGVGDTGFELNSMYSLFNVNIQLTEEGLKNIDQVLATLFSYIRFLAEQDSFEESYRELQLIEDTTFKYKSENDPIDNVEELVFNLKYYENEYVLNGSDLYFEYNYTDIKRVVDLLNQPIYNIMITTNNLDNVTFEKKEKWFGTEYSVQSIPKEWIALWQTAKPIPELTLPEKNKFLSTDYSILYNELQKDVVPDYPEKIYEDGISELWFRQDKKFLLPMVYIYFYFLSPLPLLNPTNIITLNLYTYILKHNLVKELYPASVAGLSYEIYTTEKGLIIRTGGYSENVHLLFDTIFEYMKNFDKNLKEEIFNTIKMQQEKNYYNSLNKPKSLNRDLRINIIEYKNVSLYKKYNLIKSITIDDVKNFSSQFLNEIKLKVLVQGNYNKEMTMNFFNKILLKLNNSKEIEDKTLIESFPYKLPVGKNFIRINTFNHNDINTIITNYYQVNKISIRLTCLLDFIMLIAEEPLFNILRTKKQLGYDISINIRDNNGILGYTISVNSQENKFNSEYVENEIEQFNLNIINIIKNITSKDFNHYKQSIIDLKQVVDNELKDEVTRNWLEITSNENLFNRNKLEIEAVKKIEKNDLIEFFDEYINNDENLRKLSVQVIGNAHPNENETIINDNMKLVDALPMDINNSNNTNFYIYDLENFKKSLELCPVIKTILD